MICKPYKKRERKWFFEYFPKETIYYTVFECIARHFCKYFEIYFAEIFLDIQKLHERYFCNTMGKGALRKRLRMHFLICQQKYFCRVVLYILFLQEIYTGNIYKILQKHTEYFLLLFIYIFCRMVHFNIFLKYINKRLLIQSFL